MTMEYPEAQLEQHDRIWYKTFTRRCAALGFTIIALLGPSGAFSIDETPELVSEECIDDYNRAAKLTNPDPANPELVDPDHIITGQQESAIHNPEVARLNPKQTVEQTLDFGLVQELEILGGVQTSLYSNGNFHIREERLNNFLTGILSNEEVFQDPLQQAYIYCLDRDVTAKSFAGDELWLMIPSDSQSCLSAVRFVSKSNPGTRCNSRGFTLPNPAFYGFGIDRHLVVASAGIPPESREARAQRRLATVLAHELIGHLPYSLRHAPVPVTREGIDTYEWWAEGLEDAIDDYFIKVGRPELFEFSDPNLIQSQSE